MIRRTVILAINKQGLVRTDLPDGRTVYLKEKDALKIITERYATSKKISFKQAQAELGMEHKTPSEFVAEKKKNISSLGLFDTLLAKAKNLIGIK